MPVPMRRLVPALTSKGPYTARTPTLKFEVALPDGVPISGRSAVEQAVHKRRREGTWRLPVFAAHPDRRLFMKLSKLYALIDALPPSAFEFILGAQAAAQVPEAEQRELAVRMLESKAGPEGGEAA